MLQYARELIATIMQKDPAAHSRWEVVLAYPGFHAVMIHRLSHWCWTQDWKTVARVVSHAGRFLTGIEIHPGARIGRRVFIDHGMGVVIGETAEVGDNCVIYQGVTLGGTGKDRGKRHPTLGDNVMVGAGAKILGPFRVGDNSKIAANAVVLEEIPPNSTAVGVPARIVRREGQRVEQNLDQVHMPDPVALQICRLEMRIDRLEKDEEAEK